MALVDPQYVEASPCRCCFCGAALKRDRPKIGKKYDLERWNPWMCWSAPCWARAMSWAVQVGTKDSRQLIFGPTPKQVQFGEQARLTTNTLFGGAKAVAKSYGLRWMAYGRCLRIPNVRILLLRRTFGELEISHLLEMPGEAELLKPAGADYRTGARDMRFGNGSLIRAGHCETQADVAKFLSSQWDFIIFDEIVTFDLGMFLSIASCARSTKPAVIAEGGAQVWAATNPGGRGSAWVPEWFITHEVDREQFPDYKPEDWGFVQGRLEDNPWMPPSYRQTLMNLPPVLRRQWLEGDWSAFEGQFFDISATRDGHPWHVVDLGLTA